ncbi:hypothetical protein ACHAXN_013269 [Cyclotella atomus]
MPRKKRSSSKKTKQGSSSKPISLEDVLSQAETAMQTADIEMALQLFEYAASVLRERVHGAASTSTADDANTKTLTSVLGKLGELKASTGDIEGARTEFLDAIELMGNREQHQESGEMIAEEEVNLAAAQHCEHVASLYLYLGQLSSGCEAFTSFTTGVGELKRAVGILDRMCGLRLDGGNGLKSEMEVDGDEEMSLDELRRYLDETRRQLCSAHCSIAELYLTDLCDEPDAEANCEKELESALKLDELSSKFYDTVSKDKMMDVENNDALTPPPPDALQTMANLRMSQSRPQDALDCIFKAYDRMKVGCEAMATLVGLGKDDDEEEVDGAKEKARELIEVDAASSLPSYEFRCQTAKLFMEIASVFGCEEKKSSSDNNNNATMKCAEAAIQILGSLMAENDEVIEVWYLLGCAFMASSPPQVESARYYWDQSMDMLVKVKQDMKECMDEEDEDVAAEVEAIDEQIGEVRKKLDEIDAKEEGMKD